MQKVGALAFVLWLVLIITVGLGWVLNVIHFVAHLSGPFDVYQIVRLIGIPVFIVGCILGWFL